MRAIADARIWYQSFTDPDADRPYFTRLQAYLASVASPGCQVEVLGIQPGARYPGLVTDFRCAAHVITNALTAQDQGYDGFVIGNFGEAGLAEARSAVRIPVIGLGEATMLHACTLGRTIGLVATTPVHISYRSPGTACTGGWSWCGRCRAIRGRAAGLTQADSEGRSSPPTPQARACPP